MELIHSMFNLARVHRVFDMDKHPALKKMKEERAKYLEEEMMEAREIEKKSLDTGEEEDEDPWEDDEEEKIQLPDSHDEL